MSIIKCKFESHLFDGFEAEVDITGMESSAEIVTSAVSILYATLKMNNFVGLLAHLEPLTFELKNGSLEIDYIRKMEYTELIITEVESESISSDSESD